MAISTTYVTSVQMKSKQLEDQKPKCWIADREQKKNIIKVRLIICISEIFMFCLCYVVQSLILYFQKQNKDDSTLAV